MIDFIKLSTYGVKKVIYLDSIESTNIYAHSEKEEDNVLIAAGYQYSGKGRFDHKWESEKYKNVTISLIKQITIDEIHLVNFYVSYIILRAIKQILTEDITLQNYELKLKWPNDILLNGKKVGGILTELLDINKKSKKFIIGIGVNVNQDEFPEDISHKATSLKKFFNKEFNLSQIISNIVMYFYDNLSLLKEGKLLMELWRLNTDILGKEVEFLINQDNKKVNGTIIEVQDDGGIKIKISDNSNPKNFSTFYSGEISFLY